VFRHFFSFQGRIGRGPIWTFLVILVVVVGIGETLALTSRPVFPNHFASASPWDVWRMVWRSGDWIALAILGTIAAINLVIFVAVLALTTRRLHDRNKGAVWLVPFLFVPRTLDFVNASIVGEDNWGWLLRVGPGNWVWALSEVLTLALWVWAFVELLCLRGSAGDNRFGPDPLAQRH